MSRVILGDIAISQTGPFGSQLHEEDYVSEGTPIVTVEHLGDTNFTHQNLPFVSEADTKRLSKYILIEGDIVFSRVGSIDRNVYVDKNHEGWMFSGRCIRVRADKNKVNPRYLSYYFKQNSFKKMMMNLAVGATMPSLNTKIMNSIELDLLPRENQDKIANILSAIDDKIQINNQINQELEAMAKTLYDYWFVQFDFPDQNCKPYKSSGGKMVYNPELKREIPEGWGVAKLNEVVDLISGYPFSSNDYVTSGKYKLYTIKNVQDGYTVDKVDNYLDFLPSNMSHECQLRRGDLIMSLTGNVGRVGIVYEDNVLLNQRVLKLNPNNKTHKSFIYSFFRSDVTKAHLEKMSTGTSQKNLSPIDIGNMMIPLASEDLLSKFLDYLNVLESNLVENQQLTQLRDWLLPMLMNGQVKVE
ncbi:restriction endonuclease subunit S [Streptococcus sanguinis]|uniref:restriction endonuclease subunit S n=1 Tax=Streptococcus sanguinis TaxID=1305 RepID=UPI000779CACE|nr:restriction endonuclease subunit S [Streptococcus sanguinis]